MMIAILCFVVSVVVLALSVSVLDSKAVSHCCTNKDDSVPTAKERSGDMNMFTASIAPLGSSVWKAIPRRRTATV